MKTAFLALIIVAAAAEPAVTASLSRSYSYFSVGGTTLEEIERQLRVRGPHVHSTGKRHAGATRMEFHSRIKYGEHDDRCRVVDASVTVEAKVILPRWRNRKHAEHDIAVIWDTLASDIKRHEESHIVIAKKHARDLENALEALGRRSSCEDLEAEAKKTTQRVLAAHDREQERFDRVESINFEDRILRLLRYRLDRTAGADHPFQHR